MIANQQLQDATAALSVFELQARAGTLEVRIAHAARRRLEISNRLQLGAVLPGAVSDGERHMLRSEYAALDAEIEEQALALAAIRRIVNGRFR